MQIEVDYLESKTWIEQDMRERFRWLRDNDPVYWSEKDKIWVVTKYADVAYCSKRQDLFTSAEGVLAGLPVKLGLIDEGEPRHAQLRALINKGFTPRMVANLEERFRDITKEAIDAVEGRGECEFVKSISVPLPLRLIAHMMGVRPEDYDNFHRWSDHMIGAEGRLDDVEAVTKATHAYAEYASYISEVIEDRRKNPQDDLVSILTGAKDDGVLVHFDQTPEQIAKLGDDAEEIHALHNDELIKMMVVLLVAGNETTRNGISGAVQLLIEHPEQRKRLEQDPTLVGSAVEEMLRLVSPIHSFSRTVTQDTELRGKQLERGQKILLAYPSANRDAEEFEDPDSFRIDRKPAHVAFGLGSHFCLGANLARMEMRVALEQVLRRMPGLQYAEGGPVLVPSRLVRTCAEMKVRWS